MAGERDKLEEKFMQALGAYKVQPSEKVWTQIQKKTRGNKLNRDGVLGLVLFVVVGMATYVLYPEVKVFGDSGGTTRDTVVRVFAQNMLPATNAIAHVDSTDNKEWAAGSGPRVKSVSTKIAGFRNNEKDENLDSNLRLGLNSFPKLEKLSCSVRVNSDSAGTVVAISTSAVYNNQSAFYVSSVSGCEPFEVIFKNKIKGYSKIKWQFSDGTILHSPDARHTFTSAGKYWVKLIVLAANRTEQVYVDTVRVFQNPKSDFEVYEVGAGAFSSIYFYNHSLNGVRFEWYQGDSLFSSEKEPVQYSRDLSKYSIKLKIWSENNCSDSVVITNPIDQGKDYYILFPNVFMPSRSGANAINSSKGVENSTFFSKTNGVDKYNIQIFNKWGVKLFESSNPDAIWDGYYKSVILPQDVYIWKVWGRYNSGKVFEKRGSVLLLNGGD